MYILTIVTDNETDQVCGELEALRRVAYLHITGKKKCSLSTSGDGILINPFTGEKTDSSLQIDPYPEARSDSVRYSVATTPYQFCPKYRREITATDCQGRRYLIGVGPDSSEEEVQSLLDWLETKEMTDHNFIEE